MRVRVRVSERKRVRERERDTQIFSSFIRKGKKRFFKLGLLSKSDQGPSLNLEVATFVGTSMQRRKKRKHHKFYRSNFSKETKTSILFRNSPSEFFEEISKMRIALLT